MPGTTPKGFPYALPEDKRINWPATSQQLAEKIDQEMSRVQILYGTLPAGTSAQAVGFAPGFKSAPAVIATPVSGAAGPALMATVDGISPTFCNIRCWSENGTLTAAPGGINWIAIGEPA